MTPIDCKAEDDRVERIRASSRRLVRALGFMRGTLADSALSAAEVHALIEIAAGTGSRSMLASALGLSRLETDRTLAGMVRRGLVAARADAASDHAALTLTRTGRATLRAIDGFARRQVEAAIARVDQKQMASIETGLSAYAQALESARAGAGAGAEAGADAGASVPASPGEPVIREGYRGGLLGEIVRLHAEYYGAFAGFPRSFEVLVAGDLADFVDRLDHPANQTWYVEVDGRVGGGVTIDGEDLGPETAHLRWFILAARLQGLGLGRQLLKRALRFARAHGKKEVVLWTFDGLSAARRLYEDQGFELAEQRIGARWGRDVLEQKFVLDLSN